MHKFSTAATTSSALTALLSSLRDENPCIIRAYKTLGVGETLQITEPMTLLTDYILAAGSLFFAVRLKTITQNQGQTCRKLWGLAFLFAAVAALLGGTYHGFSVYLGEFLHPALWNSTVYFIGFAGGLMISGALSASLNRQDESVRWFLLGMGISLLGLGIQQSDLALHEHMNHNDLYHLILLGALYLFYRGSRLLQDR